MTVVFLALGSNIEPENNILEAVKLLSRHVKIMKVSTVYLTKPLLHKSQPKYYNCVIKAETDIEPHNLKSKVLRTIEKELGRKRTEDKYASRTIDVDLILYDDLQVSEKDLIIPDPEISKRPFLAIPLAEIEPELVLLTTNKTIKEVAASFRDPRIVPLRDFTEILHQLVKSLGE